MKKLSLYLFVNVDWFFFSHRLDVAREAADNNYDVNVFAELTNQHSFHSNYNFTLISSPILRRKVNLLYLLWEIWKVYRLLVKEKPAIVHAVTAKPIIICGIAARLANIPFIGSVTGLGPLFHGAGVSGHLRRKLARSIYSFVFARDKSRVIVQTQHDLSFLLSVVKGLENRFHITNGSGVRLSKYSTAPIGKPLKIVMASRLLVAKGVFDYLKAAEIVNKKFDSSEIELYLAGAPDIESGDSIPLEIIKNCCLKSGVTYLGFQDDMPSFLAAADVFVYPSIYPEGLPKVLIEAAASSCAVITTDHPGCRDAIVENSTGLLVPPNTPEEIARKILLLARDHDRLERMKKSARSFAEEMYSIDSVLNTHMLCYRLSCQNL